MGKGRGHGLAMLLLLVPRTWHAPLYFWGVGHFRLVHGDTRLLRFLRKNNYGEETKILRGELTPTDLHLSIAIQPSRRGVEGY